MKNQLRLNLFNLCPKVLCFLIERFCGITNGDCVNWGMSDSSCIMWWISIHEEDTEIGVYARYQIVINFEVSGSDDFFSVNSSLSIFWIAIALEEDRMFSRNQNHRHSKYLYYFLHLYRALWIQERVRIFLRHLNTRIVRFWSTKGIPGEFFLLVLEGGFRNMDFGKIWASSRF